MRFASKYMGFFCLISIYVTSVLDGFILFLLSSLFLSFDGDALLGAGVFIVDGFLRIVLPLPLTEFLRHIPRYYHDYLSLFLRFFLCCAGIFLSLLPLSNLLSSFFLLFFLFLTRFLSIFDFYLWLRSPLILQRYFSIDFGVTTSISNLLRRGSLALAPLFSLCVVLNASWIFGGLVLFLLGLLSFFAPFTSLLRRVDDRYLFSRTQCPADKISVSVFHYMCRLPFAFWYIGLTLGFNFFLGGMAYLLLYMSASYSYIGWNLVTPFYIGMILVQILWIFYGAHFKFYASSLLISCLVSALGFVFFLLSFGGFTLYIFLFFGGVIYGFIFPLSSEVLFPLLERGSYMRFMALGETISRIMSSLSLFLYGFFLDWGLSGFFLMMVSGILVFIFGFCLCLFVLFRLSPFPFPSFSFFGFFRWPGFWK